MNLYPLISRTFSAVGSPGGTVTGATNASPIVLTFSSAHGLIDGDQIQDTGILGNTNANGLAFVKITGYSTTTAALYSDPALSTPIAGNAGYTSGGLANLAFNISQLVNQGIRLVVSDLSSTVPGTPTALLHLQDSVNGIDFKTVAVANLSGPISSRDPLQLVWLPRELSALRAGQEGATLRLYVAELSTSTSVTVTLSIEN